MRKLLRKSQAVFPRRAEVVGCPGGRGRAEKAEGEGYAPMRPSAALESAWGHVEGTGIPGNVVRLVLGRLELRECGAVKRR